MKTSSLFVGAAVLFGLTLGLGVSVPIAFVCGFFASAIAEGGL
jgi:hypothetical protein